MKDFFDLFLRTEEFGIRFEIIAGLPIWEASPVLKHQKAVDRIWKSITPPDNARKCEYAHYADIYVKFRDGSLKRPNISIFCEEPRKEDSAVSLLPEAVIEVISRGFERKDI